MQFYGIENFTSRFGMFNKQTDIKQRYDEFKKKLGIDHKWYASIIFIAIAIKLIYYNLVHFFYVIDIDFIQYGVIAWLFADVLVVFVSFMTAIKYYWQAKSFSQKRHFDQLLTILSFVFVGFSILSNIGFALKLIGTLSTCAVYVIGLGEGMPPPLTGVSIWADSSTICKKGLTGWVVVLTVTNALNFFIGILLFVEHYNLLQDNTFIDRAIDYLNTDFQDSKKKIESTFSFPLPSKSTLEENVVKEVKTESLVKGVGGYHRNLEVKDYTEAMMNHTRGLHPSMKNHNN
jgi:hypothetical protein